MRHLAGEVGEPKSSPMWGEVHKDFCLREASSYGQEVESVVPELAERRPDDTVGRGHMRLTACDLREWRLGAVHDGVYFAWRELSAVLRHCGNGHDGESSHRRQLTTVFRIGNVEQRHAWNGSILVILSRSVAKPSVESGVGAISPGLVVFQVHDLSCAHSWRQEDHGSCQE
jgi:hypothetical protein